MLNLYLKRFIVIIILIWPHLSKADEFEFSKFFHAKTLAKDALEDVTLNIAALKKTKDLQTATVSNLTALLLGLKNKYNIDFAVISNDKNNTKEALDKDIMFVTIKLKYGDEKGQIAWELTSVMSPERIEFYSVVDDGQKEVTENDIYAYKRLYRQ